jgi:phosphatidylglycerophosphate synthase
MTAERYAYTTSVKSTVSDEIINTYAIRPAAGLLVRLLYNSPVTPNQVTVAAGMAGVVAAFLYTINSPRSTMFAGCCLILKDFLDSADGQLARAKNLYSRAGRFLDSISDFVVNLLVLSAIGYVSMKNNQPLSILPLCVLGFLGITLRVSYHVFYQTSFLHLQNAYSINRVTEEIRQGDHAQGRLTLKLQSLFLSLYGWQDRLMVRIDAWCRNALPQTPEYDTMWYANATGLRLSGLLGLGTELFLLAVCSILNALTLYLYLNLVVMNLLWVVCVTYRRMWLARRIQTP